MIVVHIFESFHLDLRIEIPVQLELLRSPNSKFADISNIRQAQLEAGEAINIEEDKDESNESDSTLDCILVE